MKNILFLLLLIVASTNAQTTKAYKTGLTIGINSTKFTQDTSDYKSSTLIFGGISTSHELMNKLDLQLQGLFSSKGSENKSPSYKLRNNYVDLRILPHYKISPNFHLVGGLQFSALVSSNKTRLSNEGKQKEQLNDFKAMNVAFPLGIELELQKGIDFGVSYNIPLKMDEYRNLRFSFTIDFKGISLAKKKKEKVNLSVQQINNLKEGILLVRLKTLNRKINALEKTGNPEKATETKKLVESVNSEIIRSFKNNYSFSKVNFFYGFDSDNIKKGNFDSITFLDNSTIKEQLQELDRDKIFIADFGSITGGDTTKTVESINEDYIYIRNDKGYSDKVPIYSYSNTYSAVTGLLILSDQFFQLQRPFPFYARSKNIMKHQESINEAVKYMNSGLHEFYKEEINK